MKALREETRQVRELLAKEGFNFNDHRNFAVYFKGELGTIVWEG